MSKETQGGVSPWKEGWSRFSRNRMALISAIVFAAITLAAVSGPWLVFQYNGATYDTLDLDHRLDNASLKHPLGTDVLGRDLLVRLLYGSRISLVVGII